MKKIKTIHAVGHVLSHDITEIVPGHFKGRSFKKGHVIEEKDINKLLNLGKEHIYIFEKNPDELHENEAAYILSSLGKGNNVSLSEEVKEGKIDFFSSTEGLLKINKDELLDLNLLGEISFATLPENIPVKKNEKIGGARVIPLIIKKKKMEDAKKVVSRPIIEVLPFKKMKVGVVTTGSEIFKGRIKDKFGPVVKSKVEDYSCEVISQIIVPDDKELIKEAIKTHIDSGADMVLCTGGMSVDPDDLTPSSISELGGDLITYGSPVLPGSMFLLSYLNNIPIMGLPGCVMYSKKTIFDLVLPRILTEERLSKRDIMLYGHGGLCSSCEVCRYPNCSFGK